MSSYIYRLYAIQSFKGEKVGVYVFDGNFPDAQILSDAGDIADGTRLRKDIMDQETWFYDMESSPGKINREKLTYYTRVLKRAQKVIDGEGNVDKAIFVGSTNKKEWRGEQTLYENRNFDEVKSDTPEYSGCTAIGTIIV
jgi:hypothetical protein